MKPRKHLCDIAFVLLLLAVVTVMIVPGAGEVYAIRIYPYISFALSAVASVVVWSLEEWTVILTVIGLLLIPVVGCRRRQKKLKTLKRLVMLVGWVWIWFYLGWGANYYRNSLQTRIGAVSTSIEKEVFLTFLQGYTEELNSNRVEIVTMDREAVEQEIKELYGNVPRSCGLCLPQSFQHPKRVAFNPLYNAVGVLGYMGPFFGESQLNADLWDVEYPSVYAHELSHLLGVSSEAEAGYWAFVICKASARKEVRYSGHLQLFPHVVRNARVMLDEEEYKKWIETIDPYVIEQYNQRAIFWSERHSQLLDNIHNAIYDWYLKRNQVREGMADYGGVVRLLLTIPEAATYNKQ